MDVNLVCVRTLHHSPPPLRRHRRRSRRQPHRHRRPLLLARSRAVRRGRLAVTFGDYSRAQVSHFRSFTTLNVRCRPIPSPLLYARSPVQCLPHIRRRPHTVARIRCRPRLPQNQLRPAATAPRVASKVLAPFVGCRPITCRRSVVTALTSGGGRACMGGGMAWTGSDLCGETLTHSC